MTNVLRPRDVDEAVDMLAMHSGATILAGGTDVMVGVNVHHDRPDTVVALRKLDELRIESAGFIGAGVTFRTLELSPHRALAEAARTVGSTQIRNVATIGGNIGTASPAGDGLPFLAALDAQIHLRSHRVERRVSWDEFFVAPKQTTRHSDELIVGVELDGESVVAQTFAKAGARSSMTVALVSCCVVRREAGWSIALGAVAPTVVRLHEAEERLNAADSVDEAALRDVESLVRDNIAPIDDHRATAAYRRRAAGVLARRCVERCLSQC